MNSIIILIRTESDFERAICLGISANKKYSVHFIFVGDFSPFYFDGISNKFQKELFKRNGFKIKDFSDFDIFGKLLKKLCNNRSINFKSVLHNKKLLLKYIFFRIFTKYILLRKKNIIKKIFKKINPVSLLTDLSGTDPDYLPEQIRVEATKRKVPVFLFTHGAAGGLHSVFSSPNFEPYNKYKVFVCNKNETRPDIKNRIILGDVSSSYPYVNYLNSLDLENIDFQNDRKYRIGFMIGGTAAYTSTSGWSVQEEIIIELSENKDVAMVLKVHPRDTDLDYLKMVSQFDNLLIVKNETDRSRVSKWANIVVCNDHCSTVFEPMILGKKVVAIKGKHIPKYSNKHSPLINSSINYIKKSSEFKLNSLINVEKEDKVTNQIAWGENGSIDLAQLFMQLVNKNL